MKDYTTCPQCQCTWLNEEMQQLRRRLAIKTDLHDIDGIALVRANKKIRELEKEVMMWRSSAKSWQRLAERYEKEKSYFRRKAKDK